MDKYDKVKEEILSQEIFREEYPSTSISIGLRVELRDNVKILVVGRELPEIDQKILIEKRCKIDNAISIGVALRKMESALYDLLVVDPDTDKKAGGVKFVRVLKTQVGNESTILTSITNLYSKTPFLVMPIEGSSEYAVFITFRKWHLLYSDSVPIWSAILAFANPSTTESN